MKTFLLILFLLLVQLKTSFAQTELNKDVLEVTSNAVVCVDVVTKDGRSVVGSGFFVDLGWIVSSAHQLKDAKKTIIHTKNNGSFEIKDIIIDESQDLALLKTDAPIWETLDIIQSEDNIHVGQPVYTISCPYGLEQSLSRGVISNKERNINNKKLIQTDVAVSSGSSGAPLLNNEGQVMGVFNAVLEEANNISFVVPFDKINQIIKQAGINYKNFLGDDIFAIWQEATTSKDINIKREKYQKIADLAPWISESYYNLGLIDFELKNYEQSKNNFLKAIEINKDYYNSYVNLAIVLSQMSNLKEAFEYLEKAVKIEPENPLAYYNLGIILKQQNKNDEAKMVLADYLKLSKEYSLENKQIKDWIENN